MRHLYHYATWAGERIEQERLIRPSRRYAEWTRNTILSQWPELTFLSYNSYWEPSVQSSTKDRFWEKCGSYPETNDALGIPCWRFQVNPNGLVLGVVRDDYEDDNKWKIMLKDAVKLGSDIENWRIISQDCLVIEACKWEDDKWTHVN